MFWNKQKKEKIEASQYDLIAHLFGMEEARKHLLNVVKVDTVTSDQIKKDASLMDACVAHAGWKVYEEAVWRKLLTAFRKSLAAKTLEEREAARNQVLAHLADLHLPYELSALNETIKKQEELSKVLSQEL